MKLLNGQMGRIWQKRDQYQGQTCYVIGDGPSVKWFDFSLFRDAPVVCCNMFPMHHQFQQLNVLACTLVTPLYFSSPIFRRKDYLQKGIHVSRGYRELVQQNSDVDFVFNYSNLPFIRGRNVNFVAKSADFTNPNLRHFDWFTGGFYSALGMAIYLGFSEIKLIGFDSWTLSPAYAGHWYELGMGRLLEDRDPFLPNVDWMAQHVRMTVIGIDQTPKSITMLPYMEHTGKTPLYQENTQLLDRRFMDLLATYPDYQIR